MNGSVIAAFGWLIIANVAAMFPPKRSHWPTAYVLIALGVPLLIWVFVQNGIWLTLLLLAMGMSVLRWPVYYLWRWVQKLRGKAQS